MESWEGLELLSPLQWDGSSPACAPLTPCHPSHSDAKRIHRDW